MSYGLLVLLLAVALAVAIVGRRRRAEGAGDLTDMRTAIVLTRLEDVTHRLELAAAVQEGRDEGDDRE